VLQLQYVFATESLAVLVPFVSLLRVINVCSERTNCLSTNRSSFAAANQVATLTCWVDLLQVSLVQFLCCEQALYVFVAELLARTACIA